MGILNVEDEHQATALTLSPCSKSCSNNMLEINQKGSDHGYEEAPSERNKTKKTVRFEEGCNQIIVFTSAAAPHAPKKVVCICAPATHAGAFKCRLHRENSSHRFHGHRPSSSAPWMVKHGGRVPKVFSSPGKISQHGGFGSQTHHSKLVRAAMANVVKQGSAGVHQTQLH